MKRLVGLMVAVGALAFPASSMAYLHLNNALLGAAVDTNNDYVYRIVARGYNQQNMRVITPPECLTEAGWTLLGNNTGCYHRVDDDRVDFRLARAYWNGSGITRPSGSYVIWTRGGDCLFSSTAIAPFSSFFWPNGSQEDPSWNVWHGC